MASVIALANQKGGVGKTASAVSLSAALAMSGKRVLLVDLDAQASATLWLLDAYGQEGRSAFDVLTPSDKEVRRSTIRESVIPTSAGFDLLPSNLNLEKIESELLKATLGELRLRSALEVVRGSYDAIFVDCSPNLGMGTQNALAAADICIVPIDCRPQALVAVSGLVDLMYTLEQDLAEVAPVTLQAFALPTFFERTNIAKAVLDQVKDKFESLTLPVVHKNTKLVEAWLARQTIYQYDKTCPAAVDYLRVARELEADLGNQEEVARARRTR